MSRLRSSSARAVALVAAVCALSVAAGCGRQVFDLTPTEALDSGGAGLSAGAPELGGGGSGAASGKASGGEAGKAGGGGGGGRFGNPPGGGSGNFPCIGEGGCPDEDPLCSPYSTSPFCIGCFSNNDCASNTDAKVCNLDTKRCVQCRYDPDCEIGKACNLATQRCGKGCDRKEDCAADSKHLFCNADLHVCVSCTQEVDCDAYGPNLHCSFSSCVQCAEERQCSIGLTCVGGRCVKH